MRQCTPQAKCLYVATKCRRFERRHDAGQLCVSDRYSRKVHYRVTPGLGAVVIHRVHLQPTPITRRRPLLSRTPYGAGKGGPTYTPKREVSRTCVLSLRPFLCAAYATPHVLCRNAQGTSLPLAKNAHKCTKMESPLGTGQLEESKDLLAGGLVVTGRRELAVSDLDEIGPPRGLHHRPPRQGAGGLTPHLRRSEAKE